MIKLPMAIIALFFTASSYASTDLSGEEIKDRIDNFLNHEINESGQTLSHLIFDEMRYAVISFEQAGVKLLHLKTSSQPGDSWGNVDLICAETEELNSAECKLRPSNRSLNHFNGKAYLSQA